MLKPLNIYAYKVGSKSAKELALSLGVKRIKHNGSKFKGRNDKTVINWGSSVLPLEVTGCNVLNNPQAVGKAANKLSALLELERSEVAVPEFTTVRAIADTWMMEGHKVFCRTKLTGNSGDGIVVAEHGNEIVDAPLYTKWARIQNEYRIHVFKGPDGNYSVIDQQRKARKREVPDEEVNWKVRNLAGGFIFARGDCNPEDGVVDNAVKAVAALGLDFGAVDVIYCKDGRARVLEVNTACGLQGTTLESYTNAINKYVQNLNEGLNNEID